MSKAFWKCPNCKREFKNHNQSHSCVSNMLDDHFADKSPVVRVIFDLLFKKLESLSGLRVSPVKSAITFAHNSIFAVVHVQTNAIKLDFILDHEMKSERIIKTVQANDKEYAHYMKLSSPEEVNDELIKWLELSYTLK